ETSGSSLIAGEDQTAGPIARRRVRSHRVEKRKEIMLFVRRRETLPAQTVIETQFRSDSPCVARMRDPGGLHRDRPRRVAYAEIRRIHLFEQETRDRAAAVDAPQPGGASAEPELA